ncbi:MAG: NAD(P)/FAD-dependent oxidoreductase [Armatimonadota bacterium]|nr:NAD(P)/FAD-dependent oxidoreductase [Armatimonadota bacterium]
MSQEHNIASTGSQELLDCVIIGAGAAGLTALSYLSRFHRRAVALGGARPRSRLLLIERSHNLPGCPEGVPGSTLLRRLREQAQEMGGEVWATTARRIEGQNGNFIVHREDGATLHARKIILAMGVRDHEPDIPGIGPYVGDFLRYCPVCDGYEHTEKRLGILGSGPVVARHALFLRTFSEHVSVFLHGASPDTLERSADTLANKGIAVHEPRVVRVVEDERESMHRGCGICLEDGSEHALDVLYSALGCDVNLAPVSHLGLKLDEEGYIVTDLAQKTSLPGIYAAGDIASQLNQISIAFGQAAVAAINLHNELDEEEL